MPQIGYGTRIPHVYLDHNYIMKEHYISFTSWFTMSKIYSLVQGHLLCPLHLDPLHPLHMGMHIWCELSA